jgi:aryl-alcohol dehydrogenase-like predicted oxidoreductase
LDVVLGTATFGSDYGVANQNIVMSEEEVYLVLQEAIELGINTLDTSPEYGNAEILIGNFQAKSEQFRIFSKFMLEEGIKDTIESIKRSKDNLNIEQFEGLYFHRSSDLLTKPKKIICSFIETLLDSGITKRIGASVYSEDEILRISSAFPEIKLFQVPENILDRRLLNSSQILHLANNGYEFHIRSIFLQGLLLMDPSRLEPKFSAFIHPLLELNKYAVSKAMTVEEIAMSYAKQISWAKSVLVGVSSVGQISELSRFGTRSLEFETFPKALAPKLVDPRSWE